MLPDTDVIGFRLGIPYGDILGHRGFTHSLVFACVVAMAAVIPFWSTAKPGVRLKIIACIAIAIASHGILDAFTDGGLGVAFFAPFDATRYFFPVTPIEVSPLGIQAFFSRRGASVLASELVWVWVPVMVAAAAAIVSRRKGEPMQ
jgi:inner membrane protein